MRRCAGCLRSLLGDLVSVVWECSDGAEALAAECSVGRILAALLDGWRQPRPVLRAPLGTTRVAATGGPADSRRTWCGGALFPGRVPGTRSGTRVHSSKGLQSLDAQDIIDRYDGGY